MSEAIGTKIDRKVMRREFFTEALSIAGFTEPQVESLGDLSDLSIDRMHQLLESRILYLDVSRYDRKVTSIGGKKGKNRRNKIRSRKS